MTDITSSRTRPIRSARSTYSQRRRWRALHVALTASMSVVVVTSAIYLGVTGPTTSPVSPPAAAVAVQPAAGTWASVDGRQVVPDGGGRQPPTGADAHGERAR